MGNNAFCDKRVWKQAWYILPVNGVTTFCWLRVISPLFLQGNSTAPGVVVVAGQPSSFMGKYWANKFHIKTVHPVWSWTKTLLCVLFKNKPFSTNVGTAAPFPYLPMPQYVLKRKMHTYWPGINFSSNCCNARDKYSFVKMVWGFRHLYFFLLKSHSAIIYSRLSI